MVKAYLETLEFRTKRRHHIDPWAIRDMFRMNMSALRTIKLIDDETGENDEIKIEYLSENLFNAYHEDENGFLTTVLQNAQVEMNPHRPDDLIVRTDSETFKVDYYMDGTGKVTQLDYEGSPLPIVST